MEIGNFHVRNATLGDVDDLHHLINLSVRGLQQDDYTPAQIQGALGHVLGLDTQLIQDQTYFLASSVDHPETPVACGGWSFRKTLFGRDHRPGRVGDILDPATDPAKMMEASPPLTTAAHRICMGSRSSTKLHMQQLTIPFS